MAKRSKAKKVPRHGAARKARKGTRAYCRVCRGPHSKRQHWSHKEGAKMSKGYRRKRGLTSRGRRAGLPAAPVRRGGTKRKALTAGQKRYRARQRVRARAQARTMRQASAGLGGLAAAEARGAKRASRAAAKVAAKEARQARGRRKGRRVGGLPRTPYSR